MNASLSTPSPAGAKDTPNRRGRAAGALLRALVPFAGLLAGCSGEYPQSTIDPRSDFADVIQALYLNVFWWTMLILAVVWTILAYVLVRFRAREGDPMPRQIRGHLGLEIAWTVAPAFIVLAIVIPTIQAVFATQRPSSEDALLVEVTGHRFWWEFNYPELGVRTANELHLPVGRPVSLRLIARDVVHSFWVPALGGKRDVAPLVAVREGEEPKYTWLHFTPTSTGVHMGQCAEFCGEAHALMGLRVVVESEGEFGGWVGRWTAGDLGAPPPVPATPTPTAPTPVAPPPPQAFPEDPLVTRGRTVFLTESTCIVCHTVRGTTAQGRIGPDLTLFGARTTVGAGRLPNSPENLATWIRDPRSIKSGAEMPGIATPLEGGTGPIPTWPATGLDEGQLAAVAAYLLSLR